MITENTGPYWCSCPGRDLSVISFFANEHQQLIILLILDLRDPLERFRVFSRRTSCRIVEIRPLCVELWPFEVIVNL